jgi:hypothetical protein
LSFSKHKAFLGVILFASFLLISVVLISSFWPRYEMRFFELGLLGKDKVATDYFPNNGPSLSMGSEVDWFIYVHNHMGSPQEVIVKVKLLNSTMELPDDRENRFSFSDSFVEFPLSLSVDETLFVPFSWSISEIGFQNGSINLERLIVNNHIVEVDVLDSSNLFFYMVFELWVYDQGSQQYKFEWESERGYSSASLYMAFKPIFEVENPL